MVQSQCISGRKWTSLKHISRNEEQFVNKEVLVRARVHTRKKQGKKMVFLTLREQFATLQVVGIVDETKTVSLGMVGYAASLPNESIVDVVGVLVKPEKEVQSCSIKLEMNLLKIHCVNESKPKLPF
jgi:aspartyl-tRNA synthetase